MQTMMDRHLQPRRGANHSVMRTCAVGAGINTDCFISIENGYDLIEVRVTRANERMPHMNSKRAFLVRGGIGDIRRYYEHRNVAFCQGCLAGCDRLAAELLRRHNHLDHSFTHGETSRY
jgi:hypothetical protein